MLDIFIDEMMERLNRKELIPCEEMEEIVSNMKQSVFYYNCP